MKTLGKLEEIKNLREVWQNEATEFTPWLAENINVLSDVLGIDICVVERESSVGDFSVDIFAYDGDDGRKIIIENQLEDTNHDHLGKLITYASGKSASLVIWIVRHAREEHRAAIEWLNNHTDDEIGFLLVEIKLYKIGDSMIAPKFEVIERPNEWFKEMKRSTNITRTKLPKINDMLKWGVLSAGDVIICKGRTEEAILLDNGHVDVDGKELSLQKWLKTLTGWTSVQTYVWAVQKKTGKSLSEIRSEYMKKEM